MAIQPIIGRLTIHQTASYSTTAAALANVFGSQTRRVRVVCTTTANVLIGNSPVATAANGTLMPALVPEYFIVSPGENISAIGSGAGVLDVTELDS